MMTQDENSQDEGKEAGMSRKLIMLFIIGLSTILAGITVLIVTAVVYGGAQVNFGTVIFIGPIPVVFGAGPRALWIILLAAVLAVLTVVMFMLMREESKKSASEES